ncbi:MULTISPECIES: hypothetical protein [Halorubrum]|uniref:Uncharacterized protein n=1 Tax=Halorubrum hochstenium ATCC 700873 TaxID=1227481 RepID=M0F7D7_9EURY|nr:MULTISPECIES: hypothetical protein [Halorubrum]ELZ54509.1 hypothetical protein C467_11170 [Halorubrum hochstenium ATCC 700873]
MSAADYRLRRPIARWDDDRKYAACPRCQADVSASLGAPSVPTLRLANQNPIRVDGETINARGYICEACRYILAIAPAAAVVDVGGAADESTPWIRLGAVFVDGSKRPIVVPRREVRPR